MSQTVEFEKRTKKIKRWGRTIEFSSYEKRILFGDDYNALKSTVSKELKNVKVVTPQEIAQKHDIRVSIAKQLLEDLEKEGILSLVDKSKRARIYTKAA